VVVCSVTSLPGTVVRVIAAVRGVSLQTLSQRSHTHAARGLSERDGVRMRSPVR